MSDLKHIFQDIHDSGTSSFFLNKKGSFVQKCIICDEVHEEYLHQDEFAVEESEIHAAVHSKIESVVLEKYSAGKEQTTLQVYL